MIYALCLAALGCETLLYPAGPATRETLTRKRSRFWRIVVSQQ